MKKVIPVLLVFVLLLTGCSSSQDISDNVTVKLENGVIKFGNTATSFTEYKGYTASVTGGMGGIDYTLTLDSAVDVTNITVNVQGIVQEDMDTLKGKYYYTEYLGSRFTMADNIGGDDWIVLQCTTNNLPAATIANYASNYIDEIKMTNAQVYVDFGDFIFGNDYDEVIVRTDCALISGVAKVSVGTYNTTSSVTVVQDNKEYQLMKGSSNKYDYYTYGNYVIQVAAGLPVESYITFK